MKGGGGGGDGRTFHYKPIQDVPFFRVSFFSFEIPEQGIKVNQKLLKRV